MPLLNYSLAPRDRILSAFSADGRHWIREPGLRRDIGGRHENEMVYYACVTPAGADAYRLYYYGSILVDDEWRGRILSASSPDGLTWSDDPGVRIAYGGPHDAHHAKAPSLVALDDGSKRMYYCGVGLDRVGLILSARSVDGVTWQKDDGIRLEPAQMPRVSTIQDATVVRVDGGAWRMYVSIAHDGMTVIGSAVSSDGMHWNPEPGLRIGGRAGHPAVSQNPTVVKHETGWRMYFGGGARPVVGSDIYLATSTDGLDWHVEGVALAHSPSHPFERHGVSFPFVIAWPGLGWRMYYTGYWGRHLGERRTLAAWTDRTR